MLEPTYRQAILKAWQAAWHNKVLWILGLLAAVLGQFGFGDVFGKLWMVSESTGAPQSVQFLLSWHQIFSGNWTTALGFVWALSIVFIVILFAFVLSVISQGALISYVSEWFKNKKYNNDVKSWHKSIGNFWSLLGVNILRWFAMFIMTSVLVLVFAYFFNSDSTFISFVLAIDLILTLFLSLIISIISIFASCYVIIDGQKLWPAIKSGWKLFSKHVLVSMEVGVFLVFFNVILVVVIGAASFLAFLPSLIIWIAAGLTNTLGLAIAGFAVGVCLWTIIILISAGIFNAFTTSAWVYLFSKMHKDGLSSRMMHWLRNIF